MPRRSLEVSGFVLAGGLSLRMGRPKAALVLGSETMLERQIRLLRAVSRAVCVVGPASGGIKTLVSSMTPPGVNFIPDELDACGPLGGIYTGLLHSRTEFNLFLGCDLPFLDARLLRALRDRALESGADATVAESRDRRLQPLVAVYRRRALPAVRASLERGDNRVSSFYRRVRCQVVSWPELARAGFSPRIFANMNTLEDYARARLRL